ncbi:MAG TPA: 3-dehydroquinate synthase, partial [Chthoniobacteraceae bacterium]|nr:3-dehydroquinate synthase [Chthoniobacteraceae bacterium]
LVYVDANTAAAHPKLGDLVREYFAARPDRITLADDLQVVPGGESIKNNFALIDGFMRQMLERHMDRQSFIIIIGGGAVMDGVGLAAALVHRGLRQVRVPTTVLGQNDAGVGLKNGVNFVGGKNALGTFAPPFAVLNDFEFLRTLPERDWLCGVAEAWKVSIIRDRAFFDWLCAHADRFPRRDESAMEALVRRCAEIHLEHIRTNGDPFEYGRARPLDFGHWSAHKLELLSNFRISHGEAVANGVLLDSIYAARKGWITEGEVDRIESGLRASGFKLWFEELDQLLPDGKRAIFSGLEDFREHLGGELTVTFPKGIGARQEVHEVEIEQMEQALLALRQAFS